MSIKLYNNSPYSSDVLLPLLKRAKRLARCRGGVVTLIHPGGRRSHGLMYDASWVYEWVLKPKLKKRRLECRERGYERNQTLPESRLPGRRLIDTCGGWIQIWPKRITHTMECWDFIVCAQSFFYIALHEYVHVADEQNHKYFGEYNLRHDNRPHEIRAIGETGFVKKQFEEKPNPEFDEEILGLALEMEAYALRRGKK